MTKNTTVPLTERERAQQGEQLRLAREEIVRLKRRVAAERRKVARLRAQVARGLAYGVVPLTARELEQVDEQRRLARQEVQRIARRKAEAAAKAAMSVRKIGAREARAKARAWSTTREASEELGVSQSTFRRWMREGVPRSKAMQFLWEVGLACEKQRLRQEYVRVGTKALKQVERRKEGSRVVTTHRRVGRRWELPVWYQLVDERVEADLLRSIASLQGRRKYWQGTIMLAIIARSSEVEEYRYGRGSAGAANYGRVLSVSADARQLDKGEELEVLLDVPLQSRYHETKAAMLAELEAMLTEARADYGAIMLDAVTIHNFDFLEGDG